MKEQRFLYSSRVSSDGMNAAYCQEHGITCGLLTGKLVWMILWTDGRSR